MPSTLDVEDQRAQQEERQDEAPGTVRLRGLCEELDQGRERGRGCGDDGLVEEHGVGNVDQASQGGREAEDHAASGSAGDRRIVPECDREGRDALEQPYDITQDFARVLVDGLALRAYVVSPSSEDEQDHAVLVFAQSEEMAIELGAYELNGEPECCDVRHAPEHDARAARYLAGCVEHDGEYMRNAGWHLEGEQSCGSCGLYAYGMEKYGVCRMSNQCKECGCDEYEDAGEPPCTHEDGFSCE